MAVLNLTEPERSKHAEQPDGSTPVETARAPAQSTGAQREVEWIATTWLELDDYRCRLRTLNSVSPEEVFAILSAITSRLTEIRVVTWRNETRRLAALRSHEIDPLFVECERQFRYHSRRHTTRQFEFDLAKGIT